MAGHTNATEWCPTSIILEKIRQDGFDVYGLRNLKKMLKCIVRQETDCADAAYFCRKDLHKIWTKCRDDPFLEDFGLKAVAAAQAQYTDCEEQETSAGQDGPISRIRQIIEETEANHKTLVKSKYEMGLLAMMKHRTTTLREIERCRQAYHLCCKTVFSQKEQDRELTPRRSRGWGNPRAAEEATAQLDKLREEYKKYLKTEQDERPFFLQLCRATRTTLMRHELELFLKKKDIYSTAADWLEKTSLVKSQGGPSNGMVMFLRKQSDMMNAKQFVEGWLRINCEEVTVPRYQEYDPIKDDITRSPSSTRTTAVRCATSILGPQPSQAAGQGLSPVIKSSFSNPDIPAATGQVLFEAKLENLACESQSLHSGIHTDTLPGIHFRKLSPVTQSDGAPERPARQQKTNKRRLRQILTLK